MELERERERETERFPFSTSSSMADNRRKREPPSDSNDQIFRSKRITAVPPFDVKRAELSRHYVRELNTQFTSWVQTQLRDHPDELWQDGVQDYIKHASDILVKFSDVVEWLKANANSSAQNVTESMPNGVIPSVEKRVQNEDSKSKLPFQAEESKNPGMGLPSGSWSFGLTPDQSSPTAGPWSFGLTSSQNSPIAGLLSQSPVPSFATGGASNDQEDDVAEKSSNIHASKGEEAQQPPSPSVKRAEEPGTVVVHEVKCKLYVQATNTAEKGWKDMGMGQLNIKCKEGATRGTKEAKATIVIRNDVGKVVLNARLYPNIKLKLQKNSISAFFHTDGEQPKEEAEGERKEVTKARLYLIKLKCADDTTKLEEAIMANAPAAD